MSTIKCALVVSKRSTLIIFLIHKSMYKAVQPNHRFTEPNNQPGNKPFYHRADKVQFLKITDACLSNVPTEFCII